MLCFYPIPDPDPDPEPEPFIIYPSCISVSDDDEIDYSIKPEFYDPNLDDKDESWVEKKRHGHATDAVLSCPACFTTLCLECQRHEKYVTQYRAIFVVNCKVETERVVYERNRARPGRAKRGRQTAEVDAEVGGAISNESFKHVCCSVCCTEVGVIDEEEVYHFYNVLPSEA
ncbi:E2F-associated phosphoprotein isoform X2 [Punica granatum]|uniref:E2F-associated phosphoprotein isoform X2 n=1 Tax=Punica granatum TaxID=22663 RepID=A0A6P8BT91_PUNGR|nr:E2F-associated phosphoprotein isoform X2 [Punica granatum]